MAYFCAAKKPGFIAVLAGKGFRETPIILNVLLFLARDAYI